MAVGADVKLAFGPHGQVFLARGAPAHKDWAALPIKARAKFEQRFRLLCHTTDLVDFRKVRLVQGSDGIYEIKIDNPLLRAFAFRDGVWWITHIEAKPKKNLVLAAAKRAERFRQEHYRRAQSNG